MKLSTVYLLVCFALSPFAARAMLQHRDVLERAKRQAIPMVAVTFLPDHY
jgi:hypothetical protein